MQQELAELDKKLNKAVSALFILLTHKDLRIEEINAQLQILREGLKGAASDSAQEELRALQRHVKRLRATTLGLCAVVLFTFYVTVVLLCR